MTRRLAALDLAGMGAPFSPLPNVRIRANVRSAKHQINATGERRTPARRKPEQRDHAASWRLEFPAKRWLGRQDSNLGWRDQNPLPYRLATPQRRSRGSRARYSP